VKEPREDLIHLRLAARELARITAAAERDHLSRATWIRQVLMRAVEVNEQQSGIVE
jgi:hypothetical protein